MTTTALAAAMLLAAGAQAAPVASLGAWAGRAARRAGVARVAVLPFTPLDGSDGAEGRLIAEELATELARRGKVAVVERSLMSGVMKEQLLGQTGALTRASSARVGELSPAEAVVQGTFVTMGDRIEVDARLVQVETGLALAAKSVEGRRTWYPDDVIPAPAPFTADEAVADAYEYQTGRKLHPRAAAPTPAARPEALLAEADAMRDAPADPCAGAEARVNALQAGILELKARYWAAQARRKGFSAKALRTRPADTIPDPALRERFLELMAECPSDDAPLTFAEVRRFVSADERSFELLAACGPAGKY